MYINTIPVPHISLCKHLLYCYIGCITLVCHSELVDCSTTLTCSLPILSLVLFFFLCCLQRWVEEPKTVPKSNNHYFLLTITQVKHKEHKHLHTSVCFPKSYLQTSMMSATDGLIEQAPFVQHNNKSSSPYLVLLSRPNRGWTQNTEHRSQRRRLNQKRVTVHVWSVQDMQSNPKGSGKRQGRRKPANHVYTMIVC